LYAGGSFGVSKSTNSGKTWAPSNSGIKHQYPAETVVALAIDPQTPGTLYAGAGGDECGYGAGGVFKSVDAGMNWAGTGLRSCIASLVVDPENPSAGGPGGLFAISSPPPRTVTALTFDVNAVRAGGSYTATITGPNLNNEIYFDIQARAPGSAEDIVVLNWQMGTSESHSVPAGTTIGTWTIDGVRAHQDPQNHTGSFTQISAAITVSP